MLRVVFQNRSYRIPVEDRLYVGRESACDIVIPDNAASRKHCAIGNADGEFYIEDLGSSNGTKLNDEKISGRQTIAEGDTLSILKFTIQVQSYQEHTNEESEELEDYDEIDESDQHKKKEVTAAKTEPKVPVQIASNPKIEAPRNWSPEDSVGEILGGYKILQLLGRGSVAAVFIAKQINLNRETAFKIFEPALLEEQPNLRQHIRTQTQRAARVNNKYLAKIHQSGEDKGLLWYSMEMVSGESLQDILKRERRLDANMALVIAERIADGLASAHEQELLHLALGPSTVMLTEDGQVKVLELGMGRLQFKQRTKAMATLVHYTSPEVLDKKDCDERSDIYSLGCLLFHLLSGKPPYNYNTAKQIASAHREEEIPLLSDVLADIPQELEQLIQGMLAKRQQWRYKSMQEVSAEIKRIREDFADSLPQSPKPTPAPSRKKSNPDMVTPRAQRRGTAVEQKSSSGILPIIIGVTVAAIIAVLVLAQNSSSDQKTNQQASPQTNPSEFQNDAAKEPVIAARKPAEENNSTQTPNTDSTEPSPARSIAERDLNTWRETYNTILDFADKKDWAKAERLLLQAKEQFKSNTDIQRRIKASSNQLQLEAEGWFQDELAQLPKSNDPAALRKRLESLSNMRDRAARIERKEAELRLNIILRDMRRELAKLQREAVERLENNTFTDLPTLIDPIMKEFNGTQLAAVAKHMQTLLYEASAISWKGDWPSTLAHLEVAQGNEAISSAAVFLLLDNSTAARQSLNAAKGGDEERRNALIRFSAAVLEFNQLSDMQYFDIELGEPSLHNSQLIANNNQLTELRSNVQLGKRWEMRLLAKVPQNNELIISVIEQNETNENIPLTTTINSAIFLKEDKKQTRSSDALNLNIIFNGDTLEVYDDGQLIDNISLNLQTTAVLSFSLSGTDWAIDELLILGDS